MDAMKPLVRDRWMIVVRGALAAVFGLALLGWEDITLSITVELFATYAFVDGMWAIITTMTTSDRRWGAWPVALEGLVGAVVGVVAIGWPLRVPADVVSLIIAWGIVTGILEIVTAARMPRDTAGHWLFATGGLTSISLALLLGFLRHSDVELVARLMGGYALLFGLLMVFATVRLPRSGRRAAGAHGRA